jgi:hypothetical protein
VQGAGDADGDGFADMVTSSPFSVTRSSADPMAPRMYAGHIYVIPGGCFGHASTPRVLGGELPELLRGTAEAEILVGGAGDDQLLGGGGGDVLIGGAGDDTLVVPDPDFFRVDGGPGQDVLRFAGGPPKTFDLTRRRGLELRRIETIHIGSVGHTVVLDLAGARAWARSPEPLTIAGVGVFAASLPGWYWDAENNEYSDGVHRIKVTNSVVTKVDLE